MMTWQPTLSGLDLLMRLPYEISRDPGDNDDYDLLRDVAFARDSTNSGDHTAPGALRGGIIQAGVDGLSVELVQGIDENAFKTAMTLSVHATTGLRPDLLDGRSDWEELMRGGLQGALESQVVIFAVKGASRALTHQLVRTRKAVFHQQSQRATYLGAKPEIRMPESIFRNEKAREAFRAAARAAAEAYQTAVEEDIAYQDARFILPEGTTTDIVCHYPLRTFLDTYAYRACSMFMWEHAYVMRVMGKLLSNAHPMLEPYIKISCEKTGEVCRECSGDGKLFIPNAGGPHTDGGEWGYLVECHECNGAGRIGARCTFQGWENVEGQCDFPWAKQDNRVFLPDPKFRITSKEA